MSPVAACASLSDCSPSQICQDAICQCPPGYQRDMVVWYAPADTCAMLIAGMDATYLTSSTIAFIIALFNFFYCRKMTGTARTTFLLCGIWLVFFCLMNLAHYLEGYRLGPWALTGLFLYQQTSALCLTYELYHVIAPMMLLTRRRGAAERTKRFMTFFVLIWVGANVCFYVAVMIIVFDPPPAYNAFILFVYNYLLVEFIINTMLSYFIVRRLIREIHQVRDELLTIRRDDDRAANILKFYEQLGTTMNFILVNMAFVTIFIVILNVGFVYLPEYTWPFFACTVLSYPALGLLPMLFWFSGGEAADRFADDFEASTVASGLSMRL